MRLYIKILLVVCSLLILPAISVACADARATTSNSPSVIKTAKPPSTAFKVDGLAVNPSEVDAGIPTLVTAKVTNTGISDDSYQVNVRLDNTSTSSLPTYIGSDKVTIPAGATQLLSVPMTVKNPGTYKVTWDNVSQTLLVNPQSISAANTSSNSGPNLASDFTAVDVVTGKKVSLSQFKGSVILLNFVNYGCNPSTNQVVGAELLAIKQLQSQRNDFIPFSVFCGCCPPDVLRKFAQDNDLTWPWVLDSDYSIAQMYGDYLSKFGYPTLVFIDKDQVIQNFSGYLDHTALSSKIDNLATARGVN